MMENMEKLDAVDLGVFNVVNSINPILCFEKSFIHQTN